MSGENLSVTTTPTEEYIDAVGQEAASYLRRNTATTGASFDHALATVKNCAARREQERIIEQLRDELETLAGSTNGFRHGVLHAIGIVRRQGRRASHV